MKELIRKEVIRRVCIQIWPPASSCLARCYLSNRPALVHPPATLALPQSLARALSRFNAPGASQCARCSPNYLDGAHPTNVFYSSRSAKNPHRTPPHHTRARRVHSASLNSIEHPQPDLAFIYTMSGTHPFPLSNNRASYTGQDVSPTYPSGPGTATYPYPSFQSRHNSFDAPHGRMDPATAASISGMFHHHEEDEPQQHYSRSGFSGDAFSHPHAHQESREQLWHYSPPSAEAFRARLEQPNHDVGAPSEYEPPMAQGPPPPGPSHGQNIAQSGLPASMRSEASNSSAGRSRREKPRLELAADQPLTTQGKPRTRVYVACVQW